VTSLLVSSACVSSADRDLRLAVRVADKTFKTGEPISLELDVRYVGKDPLPLNFSTSQRYDFQIEKEGEILWRWSDGRTFAQVLGQFPLSPELPHVRYRAVFKGHLPPGRYTVRGILTTSPRPFSAVAEITIQ
jgi:hypothetical protein